jgi:hypothetical protein
MRDIVDKIIRAETIKHRETGRNIEIRGNE